MGFNYIPVGTTGFPYDLAQHFIEQGYGIFVETGTYYGDNALKASEHFKHVYTIEAAFEIFEKAKQNCSKASNVTLVHGESDKILEDLLKELNTNRIVFWLDAHYSGGNTHECSCPLLREIQIINDTCGTDCIIIIDDARFVHSIFYGERYADYFDFVNTLSPGKSRYISCANDMFIATPYAWRPLVDAYCNSISLKQVHLFNKLKNTPNLDIFYRLAALADRLWKR